MKLRRWHWVVGGSAVAGATAVACMTGPTETVHFNTTVVDFGAPPPPLEIRSWDNNVHRAVPSSNTTDIPLQDAEGIENQRNAFLAQGTLYEKSKDYPAALLAYKRCLDLFTKLKNLGEPQWNVPADDRETVRKRVEVLSMPDSADRRLFLSAVPAAREDGKVNNNILFGLAQRKGPLQAHARYRLATGFQGKREQTAKAFLSVAALGGVRREPALIMGARALLAEGDPAPTGLEIRLARGHLQTLLREFPNTRFRQNAQNWLTRCDLLELKYPEAQCGYMRLYNGASNTSEKVNALSSMRMVFDKMNPFDADKLRELMLGEPALLQPYLDYRLRYDKSNHFRPLASFARWFLDQKPSAKVAGEITARLAEISYLSQDYVEAAMLSQKSLETPNDRLDLATYVRAATLRRLNRTREAAAMLRVFPTKFPNSYLKRSAQELYALSSEALQDWGAAFQTYRDLGYDVDVAYVTDVRMPVEALKKIVDGLKPGPLQDKFKIALGLRYMRKDQLELAEKVFASVPDARRQAILQTGSKSLSWIEPVDPNSKLDSVPDALQTARDLIALRAKAKANSEALYELGSYYYTRRNLLLYNASLWQGSRSYLASYFWNDKVATRDDRLAWLEHHYEHECLYQARKILIQGAESAKGTEVAAKSLYRAACASRRLANFNGWWRTKSNLDLGQEAARLMRRVYTEYPSSPLAANARKYETVFRDEAKNFERQSLFAVTQDPDL